jgi:hypothetical protein
VFQELKRYLTSPPVMVASETGEPLLLYIVATSEVVSMVLVVEQPESRQPQLPKGTSIGGFGFQDPDPTEGLGNKEAVGSKLSESSSAPEPQVGS